MVHKFKYKSHFYVLDVESGSFFEVDKTAYDLIDEFNLKEPKNNIQKEVYQELNNLIKENLLYSKPVRVEPKDNRNIKALCLHLAHDCNLSCEYCFASQGSFKGKRSLMSFETAKQAIDFVVKESGDRYNIEIDFFGGEPLLNFDVLKRIVEYVKENQESWNKNFHFTVTTNGILLDKYINWLDENMDNIVLSIDGRKEINDRLRKTINKKGSYDLIIDSYKNLSKRREGKKDYYLRATYTSKNLDFSEDVKHLHQLGFKSLSCEPVVLEPNNELALKEENLDKLLQEYDNLLEYYLNNDFNFFHFNISSDPCLYKRLSGCGAGTDYLAVTPEGDLFPCHQFVGEKEFKIGDVYNGINNSKINEKFKNATLLNKESCKNCWAKYYCGGGCHANNYHYSRNLNDPNPFLCKLQKKRLECALIGQTN